MIKYSLYEMHMNIYPARGEKYLHFAHLKREEKATLCNNKCAQARYFSIY